jgi:hypothetical protein
VNWRGEEHPAKVALSSEHSNVEPVSVDENVNVAKLSCVVALGPLPIVV